MGHRFRPTQRITSRRGTSPSTILKAAALRYRREVDLAPRLVAKGQGPLAERILNLAQEHGVPVWQDEGLAEALLRLEVDSLIPPELYQAVAEVLAFIYRLDTSYHKG